MKKKNQVPKKVRDLIALTPSQREAAMGAWGSFMIQARPEGTRDAAKRWYPDSSEHCECCEQVRQPSRSWPNSLYKHCLTLRHKEKLFGTEHSHVLAIKHWFETIGLDITECDGDDVESILLMMERDLLLQNLPDAGKNLVCSPRQRL
jgi:hypothetical protein